MEPLTPSSILYGLVKGQLSPEMTFEQTRERVLAVGAAAGVADDIVLAVIARFQAELVRTLPAAPRLLVDWGELPRVGHQVRPEFNLLCPGYENSRPEVRVVIDRQLDHDDRPPRVQTEEPGLWSFQVPFRMTSDGLDCRPGQYVIEVDVSFREVPAGLPRFFRCRIRLMVNAANSQEGGVLEIDGDGQSMVNLQGYNLKQFSKVILKGGGDSVINLQDAIGPPPLGAVPAAPVERPATTFRYEFKVDSEKQSRLPVLASDSLKRAYLDKCGFFFEDGRRVLVWTRPRITFGRSRDNDVVIRFLPRSEANDGHSRNISRTHFIAELTPAGIELRDESTRGIEVNYRVVREREVIAPHYAGDVIRVELGVTGTVSQKFELDMALFGPHRSDAHDDRLFWDELYAEIVGGRLSRLHRDAIAVKLDAMRYDRVTSLPHEESYVHLLREALIGGSPAQSAIVLRESGPQAQARLWHIDRTFWLEPLPGGSTIRVDNEVVPPRHLLPLSPGMEIQFDRERTRFDHPTQWCLD